MSAAVAGLQPGSQVAEGDAARTSPCGRRRRPGTVGSIPRASQPSTGSTTTRRPSSAPPFDVADDLVAGNEREADDVLEVAGAATVQGREVRAADPGQPGPDPHPGRAGELDGVELDEARGGRRGLPCPSRRAPTRPARRRSGARSARTRGPSSVALRSSSS